jgi:hypothetical protein
VIKPFSVGLLLRRVSRRYGRCEPGDTSQCPCDGDGKEGTVDVVRYAQGLDLRHCPLWHPSDPGAAQLARCIGVPISVITSNPPSVSSPNFSSPNGDTVSDQILIFPSAKAARANFAVGANPRTPKCLKT